MPAASSSRRKPSRRQPSSDGIEEDQSTQYRRDADDVDEEEEPSRSAKVKKEKQSKAKRSEVQRAPRDADDEEDEEEDDRIDVENFQDQPLSKDDAAKIHGMIKDWEMIRKQSQDSARNLMVNIGVSMADLMEGDEAKQVSRMHCHAVATQTNALSKALDELDGVMKNILDIEEEMVLNEGTIDSLYQQLNKGLAIVSRTHRVLWALHQPHSTIGEPCRNL